MKKAVVISALLVFILGGVELVHATPVLYIEYSSGSGSGGVLVVDDNVGVPSSLPSWISGYSSGTDSDTNPGEISYSATNLGPFSVIVTLGITYPSIGTSVMPRMHLNHVEVQSSGGSGTLTIWFSEIGLGPLAVPGFYTHAGGTGSQGEVEVWSYVDTGNTYFGTGTQLADLGPFLLGSTGSSFGATTSYVDSSLLGSTISMTTKTKIELNGGTISSADVEVDPVPEPATLLLFGTGIAGIAGVVARRRKRR